MLLNEYLSVSARRNPDKVALVSDSGRWTYGELRDAASSFAGFLIRQGLQHGDRVAIYTENIPEAVIAVFGVFAAGGCIVVINAATRVERLGFILENCGARCVIAAIGKVDQVREAATTCSIRPFMIWTGVGAEVEDGESFSRILNGRSSCPPILVIDTDLAAIIYTSGSTGKPKGATFLHRSIHSAVESIADYLENNVDDVILALLPLSSSYGLLQVLVTFWTGGTVVLENGFTYPYETLELVKREKITGFAGAPTIWAILLRLEGLEDEVLTSIRYITNAAAAMPVAFVPKLRRLFPAARIFLMHGLTECLRTTYLPPEEVETRPNSVGRGMRNVELWVEDADRNRLPPGHVGEMVVRGSSLMAGYWNDPEATSKALSAGPYPWERVLRTGDLFRMDEQGYFYFVARSDEMIKCKGEKVSPIEVEDVIYSIDGVNEVRVIGVPDTLLGQAIRAEIVVKDGRSLTVKEVKAQCRRFLEDFKIPKIVDFVTALPKTPGGGKIKRTN